MLTKAQIKKIRFETAESEGWLPAVFDALSDPGRFRIFRLLTGYRDLCVTDVSKTFGITLSAASQQLKILERAGLVQKTRMGQMVCYEINHKNTIAKKVIKMFYAKSKAELNS